MEPVMTRRSTLTLLILGVVLLAIGATLVLVRTQQDIRQRAAPTTTLELTPATNTVNQGDEFTLNLNMNTGSNSVYKVDVVVTYDNLVLEGVRFEKGNLFANSTATGGLIGNGVGRLTLEVPTTESEQGQGLLGRLVFRASNPSSGTQVRFNPQTTINAVDETGNVFSSSQESTVVVTSTVPADTDVTLSTVASTVDINQELDVLVGINTGVNRVNIADLVVTFDPNKFQGMSITSIENSLLPNGLVDDPDSPLVIGTITGGTAQLLVSNTSTPAQGIGNIAKLRLKAIATGSTNVEVAPSTFITGMGSDQNLTKSRGTLTITIQNTAQPEPTPVATPVSSPSGNANTNPCQTNMPAAPTGVTAVATATNKIELRWTPKPNVTHYGIVYGVSASQYLYGAPNVGNVSVFTVQGLSPNSTYYFAVYSGNDCGSSGYSSQVSAKTFASSGGIGGAPVATPAPGKPLATPSPALGFQPIPPTDPTTYIASDNPFLAQRPKSTILPVPGVSIPPDYAPTGQAKNSLLTPLGGIFLIISAVFVGIFFWKMRAG